MCGHRAKKEGVAAATDLEVLVADSARMLAVSPSAPPFPGGWGGTKPEGHPTNLGTEHATEEVARQEDRAV